MSVLCHVVEKGDVSTVLPVGCAVVRSVISIVERPGCGFVCSVCIPVTCSVGGNVDDVVGQGPRFATSIVTAE